MNLSVSHDGFVTPPEPEFEPRPTALRHVVRKVRNGDVELHAEALLNEASASTAVPVLFLSEAEAPSTRWSGELLHTLAESTGGAIWFDTRDCGRSSWLDAPYDITDLVVDVLVVLDAFEVDAAHVVGRGMGGEVAQRLALGAADRVQSLTLLSTTPGRREEFGLPEQWLIDQMSERLFVDPPTDPAGQIEWLVELQEWFAGPVFGFDRDAAHERAVEEVGIGFRGPSYHGHAVVEAEDVVDYLHNITTPSLVIHGTADPVFPVAHAQALADRLANAELVLIEGVGHDLPGGFVPSLIELIRKHIGVATTSG